MEVSFATWVQVALTAAIAAAAFMQWFVARRLASIEANREKVRLVLRFSRNPGDIHRLSLRVANPSPFGVMLECVNCAILTTYAEGHETFKKQITREWRDVLAPFAIDEYDLHADILTTIDKRNAEFRCEIETSAVYLDHGGVIPTAPTERVTVAVEEQHLVEFPEG